MYDAGTAHGRTFMVLDSGLVLSSRRARLSPQPSVARPSGGDEQYPDPVLQGDTPLASLVEGAEKPTDSTRWRGRD
jgi:hypothetical protein